MAQPGSPGSAQPVPQANLIPIFIVGPGPKFGPRAQILGPWPKFLAQGPNLGPGPIFFWFFEPPEAYGQGFGPFLNNICYFLDFSNRRRLLHTDSVLFWNLYYIWDWKSIVFGINTQTGNFRPMSIFWDRFWRKIDLYIIQKLSFRSTFWIIHGKLIFGLAVGALGMGIPAFCIIF